MIAAGTTIDRYLVESVIGRGGMATVYRVRHVTLGSTYALKVMALDRSEARERFRREARAQSRLRHPNVVAVSDFLDVGGRPGLVMELVTGPVLRDWLGTKRYPVAEVDPIFRGIVEGVSAAHALGIVHRDLKPANVLLAELGGRLLPKVTDFGIAKLLADDVSSWSLTASGTTMGTPGYLAPEQIRSAKHVDTRADIFSLGCLLFRIACGRAAFTGDIREVFNAVVSGAYPHPRVLAPDLPERFVTTMVACLQVDRDARPQSCGEVLALFGNLADVVVADNPRPAAMNLADVLGLPSATAPAAGTPEGAAAGDAGTGVSNRARRWRWPWSAPAWALFLSLGAALHRG